MQRTKQNDSVFLLCLKHVKKAKFFILRFYFYSFLLLCYLSYVFRLFQHPLVSQRNAVSPQVYRSELTLSIIVLTLSPPNFFRKAFAMTRATVASATVEAAGTLVTSLRS